MNNHTPGPWATGPSSTVWKDHGRPLYVVSFCHGPESQANAQLIAAAPDLLAACQAVAGDCDSIADGDDFSGMSDAELFGGFLDVLGTAIRKATGDAK
jgi:hypothetical protein